MIHGTIGEGLQLITLWNLSHLTELFYNKSYLDFVRCMAEEGSK